MSVPQRELLQALAAQCNKTPERFRGYRQALFDALGQIVILEARKLNGAININQELQKVLEALGDRVHRAEIAPPPGRNG